MRKGYYLKLKGTLGEIAAQSTDGRIFIFLEGGRNGSEENTYNLEIDEVTATRLHLRLQVIFMEQQLLSLKEERKEQ